MKRKRRPSISQSAASAQPNNDGTQRKGRAAVPPESRRRLWLFRIGTLLLAPLLFLAVLEASLRLLGLGHPTAFFLRDTINGRPVWIENQKFGWRFFPATAARAPRATLLPVSKPPNTCRIFVFGESAAYGDPKPDFGFPRQLAVLLRERFPGTRFEVVNAAMTAINSHVILPIARDCATKEGDLWVIYMGNNEVVGPYGAGTVFGWQAPPLPVVRASVAIKAIRTGQLLDAVIQKVEGSHETPQTWAGMEMFTENRLAAGDPRLARVYAHFRHNFENIVRTGVRVGAKIIVCTVASNLKDCAPFASLNRTDWGETQKAEWDRCFQSGVASELAGETATAADFYRRAAQLDGNHAELLFRRARCELSLSNLTAASKLFAQARDNDALRFRTDRQLNEIIRQTAIQWPVGHVWLVDAEEVLGQASAHRTTGSEFFYEHVHLNFAGNYLLARAVAECAAQALPSLAAGPAAAADRWLMQEACAQRMAFTDWNRLEIAELLRDRMRRPPFTFQCDHAERDRQLAREIAALRSALSPAALASLAEVYRRATAAAPDDWALHENLARLLKDAGDLDGSAKASQRVVELLPHHAEGWCQLGLSLEQLGRTTEAVAALNRARARRPFYPQALLGLGRTCLREKRFTQAVEHFSAALRWKPDLEDAHVGLGQAFAGLGDTGKALTNYRAALQFNPTHPAARSNLLAVINREGRLSEQVRLLEDAVRLNPRDPAARLDLGKALLLAGRQSEAGTHFAAAVELEPENGEAHYLLGLELAR